MFLRLAVAAAILLACFATPDAAAARRGIPFVHWGEEIDVLHDPAPDDADTHVKIGYYYNRFGVLWILDIWSWGGTYCLYEGNTYEPITKEMAEGLAGKKLSPSSEYRYPLGLIVIVAIVALVVVSKVLKKKSASSTDAAMPPAAAPPAAPA